MAKKIKQALKQLRKALHEQREYELLLRAESTHRYDTLVEKLMPLIPFLVSKFGSSTNDATSASAQARQILLLTKLVRSLTDDQTAAIYGHLSIEQKMYFLELRHSMSRAASSNTSPSAAQAAPHTTGAKPAASPQNAPVRHWFYPSSVIGCGLNIDNLPAEELTCSRHEVTCAGCLAQLRADQENNPTRVKADAAVKEDPVKENAMKEDAMTVAELIEQLQKLPADLPVYIADWSGGYALDCPMTVDNGPRVSAACDSLPECVLIGMEPTNER